MNLLRMAIRKLNFKLDIALRRAKFLNVCFSF